MKKDEVPQDNNQLHQQSFKQLMYAVDNSGDYVKVPSVGWEPENVAMAQAWEHVNEKIALTKARVISGELSPVAYYMEKCLMDLPTLAAHIGKFQWQVKRHFKPAVFQKLNEKLLQRYADVFQISREQLLHVNEIK
ncbi:hypothetical protein COR50_00615 [Chitinophaga caeni]|uniref:HTH cro/C1-type domain-containing protein n=1 Tax=Chitinophaga caeni TaxID=2029983 RepID=A0A291QP58_9BACT|nr:hypothetical protein [Chitinophaga caeni]ATL45778.1 hypothetical protein COR50_00615 [Chitinophaga caeni]